MDIRRPVSSQPMPEDAKRVFKGVVFDAYQWEVEGYDGSKKTFEKLKRADSALVIPVTEDGRMILGYQEQPGRPPFVGMVGGRMDEGESPLEAAKRELLEETGYASEDWELLDAVQPTMKIDWAVYTFIARGCRKVAEQDLDGAERIELRAFSFKEFIEVVSQEEFGDTELKLKVLAARLKPEILESLRQRIMGERLSTF